LIRRALILSVAVLAGCAPAVVKEAGVNHREQVQDSDEAGLWEVTDRAEALLKNAPERVRDETLQRYVNALSCRLAPDICGDVRIYVLRQPVFNAFMMPNGVMAIYTGLLLRCENEAQLATVIAHELAHYRKRHTLNNWRRAKNTSGWLTAVGMLSGGSAIGAVATLGAYVSMAGFSREQEREADTLGFQAMAAVQMDVQAPSRMWRNLLEEERVNPRPFMSGLFASHPAPPERERYLAEMAQAQDDQQARDPGVQRFAQAVQALRPQWLEDELSRRAYRQSEILFARLAKLPFGQADIALAQATLYRKRDQAGDLDRAIAAYQRATQRSDAPAKAFRDLGLALRKSGRNQDARRAFQEYLKRVPSADDAAMIRSYIDES
jgi:beta-barrel assembly-enhancing protease